MNSRSAAQAGFSLIEVLVAMLVLSFGLLGYALLQTTTVRFTQSANYRTQATNLTYQLIDQMRANRVMAATYVGDYAAVDDPAACQPKTGDDFAAADFTQFFGCQLGRALGAGASANVAVDAGTGEVVVTVAWGDERWDEAAEALKFEARTRL